MKKRYMIPYGIVLVALLIASFFDYEITAALYMPEQIFGIIFERFVLIPVAMILPITCYMLYRVHKSYGYLLAFILANSYIVFDVLHYWMNIEQNFYVFFCGCVLWCLCVFVILQRFSLTFWMKHKRFLLFTSMVFISAFLTTTLLKQGWGRIRYREMLDDVSQFTPWWHPNGLTYHRSFPSGHVTTISVVLCWLEYHHAMHSQKQTAFIAWVIVWSLIILMMISRMMRGAHFLSDVSVGFIITYTYYLIYKQRFFRGVMS